MKPYMRPIPVTWWLKRKPYFLFMLREISSVFIAVFLILLLVMINRLSQGPEAYESFLAGFRSPGAILFHVVVLAFALLHTITWFHLTPKAMAIWRGEERLPGKVIIGSNYLAWILISGVVLWLISRG